MTDIDDRISILIVDDKQENQISLEATLGGLGLSIVRAGSGHEALRQLLQQDFAAILLDVNMPGMDGFETAGLIRQRKSSETTPILFITAHGDEHYVARGYTLGAVDYILTPVVPEVLRTKVGVFVELHRNARVVRLQAEKLEQRANQLAALASDLTHAEQCERHRLAQILHDDLQQLLVAARMRLSTMDRGAQGQGHIVVQIDDLLGKAIESSRSLTGQLSPPILYDAGLLPALQWLGRQMVKNHGLSVGVDAGDETELAVDNHRAFAYQAVRELLFNCVKHAGVNRARVSIVRTADGFVSITVEDAGQGFDPAIIDANKGQSDHFGLLSIRERVKLMNGRFKVQAAPSLGASVTIELPALATSRQAPVVVEIARNSMEPSPGDGGRPPRGANGAKVRVVLTDDHEILRKGLRSLLAEAPDIEVVGEAADGATAIELTGQLYPDVVVMDITMPGMTGIEATRKIKEKYPDIRVVILSMHSGEDMAAAASLSGASAYLSKGGPPEDLIAAIRNGAASSSSAHVQYDVRSEGLPGYKPIFPRPSVD